MTPNELETLRLLATETGIRVLVAGVVIMGPWVVWAWWLEIWPLRRAKV